MHPPVFDIFAGTMTDVSTEEEFLSLHENGSMKIERIVSHGQASAKDFWYDQAGDEWVLLLRGEAELEFEHDAALVKLNAGSWLNIPRGTRHRVESTTADAVWLAVHMKPSP